MGSAADHGRIPDDELDALLELRVLPGLGEVRFRRLLARYGSARAVLEAPADALGQEPARERGGTRVKGRVARARSVIDSEGVHVMAVHLPGYPDRLHHLADPPCVLFARGRLDLLARPVVTVVGARRSSAYGRFAARTLARDLAASGVAVASGLARGIDAAAHEGAVPDTIAVLGCGIDVPYPWENRELLWRIAADGLVLSEFAPGEPALGHHFPRRNRVLAALALGIVVVEAGERSGSIITAEHGLDLGRDVFCIPPNIGHLHSPGVRKLIDDGAAVVTTADEILDSIGVRSEFRSPHGELAAPSRPDSGATAAVDSALVVDSVDQEPGAARLLGLLYTEPRHVDELAEDAGLPASAVLVGLLELEMRGLVRQLPGMLFVAAPERVPDAREPGRSPGLP